MIVYLVENTVNGKVYVGQTSKGLLYRRKAHEGAASRGSMLAFHCALRKYGKDKFAWFEICRADRKDIIDRREKATIREFAGLTYNMTAGGDGTLGLKPSLATRRKMSVARRGRRPALGMRHTAENRAYFKMVSLAYWAQNRKYSEQLVKEVLKLGCTAAIRKYGISKTHYYRMKKRNDAVH